MICGNKNVCLQIIVKYFFCSPNRKCKKFSKVTEFKSQLYLLVQFTFGSLPEPQKKVILFQKEDAGNFLESGCWFCTFRHENLALSANFLWQGGI